jgi:integrase
VTKVESRRRTRANGEGGVRHEKARGRWVGTVTVGFEDYVDDEGTIRRRQVRKSVTGRTKVEALERLRELQGAVEAGMDPAPRDLTVARFLSMWLDDVLPGTVAPSTEKMYRDVVRLYVVPHIGQKRLRTLQARHVSLMLRALEAEGRAGNTRRLARSVLRRALRWGEAEGMVARNVAAIADGVKVGTREGRTLTPVQARQLLAHVAGDRMEAAFAFAVALALGLRRAELLGLAWSDLTLDATPPRLTVRRNLTRVSGRGIEVNDTKTAKSRRSVHLPVPVVAALRAHRARQAEERLMAGSVWPERPLGLDLVFRTPVGTPIDPDNFRNLVYDVTMRAFTPEDERPASPKGPWPTQYRWSPHELRHSAASLLIAQGVPMKIVSETLGHASIRITSDVYGHLFDDAGAIAAEAMTAALWSTAD